MLDLRPSELMMGLEGSDEAAIRVKRASLSLQMMRFCL